MHVPDEKSGDTPGLAAEAGRVGEALGRLYGLAVAAAAGDALLVLEPGPGCAVLEVEGAFGACPLTPAEGARGGEAESPSLAGALGPAPAGAAACGGFQAENP